MNNFTIDTFAGTVPEVNALNEERFFSPLFGAPSQSGETVNPNTSITHAPVWQAVNILAGDMAQIPIEVVRNEGESKIVDDSHPVHWLFNHEPNSWQTPGEWMETMMLYALLWGNGISVIQRKGTEPVALLPLNRRFDRLAVSRL